ncbi:unnamed protein product [Rhodiola kirilowii]
MVIVKWPSQIESWLALLYRGLQLQQVIYKSRVTNICSNSQKTETICSLLFLVATETKETKPVETEAAAKPKAKPKVEEKPLPQMMEEDVIPALKSILEAQTDITDIELSFQDNKLEGSFQQNGTPHSFWAFFPDGSLIGPKGFSISSFGSPASTVEPFLVDEKKPTSNLVVFWIEKRLAAQGILPVWTE